MNKNKEVKFKALLKRNLEKNKAGKILNISDYNKYCGDDITVYLELYTHSLRYKSEQDKASIQKAKLLVYTRYDRNYITLRIINGEGVRPDRFILLDLDAIIKRNDNTMIQIILNSLIDNDYEYIFTDLVQISTDFDSLYLDNEDKIKEYIVKEYAVQPFIQYDLVKDETKR